jgi:hypothetical protein
MMIFREHLLPVQIKTQLLITRGDSAEAMKLGMWLERTLA